MPGRESFTAPCIARSGRRAAGAGARRNAWCRAAALDGAVGRFEQHTEVCVAIGDELTVVANQTRQAGEFAGDLVVVEDVGQVVVGVLRGQFGGKFQLNRRRPSYRWRLGRRARTCLPLHAPWSGRHGAQGTPSTVGQGHGVQVTGKEYVGALPSTSLSSGSGGNSVQQ